MKVKFISLISLIILSLLSIIKSNDDETKNELVFVINIHAQKVVDIVMKTTNAFVQKAMIP